MKKICICLIPLVLIAVLSGCYMSPEESTGEAEATASTSAETPSTQPQTTDEPTESATQLTQESTQATATEPFETQGRDPSLPVWFTDNKNVNYDEGLDLMEQEIYYMDDLPPTQWHVTIDGVQELYRIRMTDDGLVIEGTGMDGYYHVPDTMQLSTYQLAGANGWAAYVYSDKEILQVDLLTGAVDPLVNPCKVFDVWLCEGGLYYAIEWGGETERLINLYRRSPGGNFLYPYLTNTFVATTLFEIQHPASSHSNIFWTQLNPELFEILEAELANGNSPYKANHGECWESGDIRVDSEGKEALRAFCIQLQQDTGIPALIKVRYDPETRREVEEIPLFLE